MNLRRFFHSSFSIFTFCSECWWHFTTSVYVFLIFRGAHFHMMRPISIIKKRVHLNFFRHCLSPAALHSNHVLLRTTHRRRNISTSLTLLCRCVVLVLEPSKFIHPFSSLKLPPAKQNISNNRQQNSLLVLHFIPGPLLSLPVTRKFCLLSEEEPSNRILLDVSQVSGCQLPEVPIQMNPPPSASPSRFNVECQIFSSNPFYIMYLNCPIWLPMFAIRCDSIPFWESTIKATHLLTYYFHNDCLMRKRSDEGRSSNQNPKTSELY